MLRSESMKLITRDKFGLAVETAGEAPDVGQIRALLQDAGAASTEVLEHAPPIAPASPRFLIFTLLAIMISCLAAGYLTYWGIKLFPETVPMVHMLKQPRLDAQKPDDFFRDGFGMRMPVRGTVMRGSIPYTIENQEDADVLANPLPRTERVLMQGKQAFMNHCVACHGVLGDGDNSLGAAYGAKPANLVSKQIIALPDGEIYHVVRMGKNAMPSYSADLDENERWAVVHYVRVLERALNAKDTDIE